MKKKDYLLIGGLVWRPLLQSLITIVSIVLLPVKSWISIALSVVVWQYLFSIFTEQPKFKRWITSLLVTFAFFGVFTLISSALGLLGAIGVFAAPIVILLLLAAWKIWENWKVYDAVTTWGAERLRGKHKRDFDLTEVIGKNGK